MGILSRWKQLSKPRTYGYGKLWDNTNTPVSKGPPATTVNNAISTPTRQNYFTPGPNPEPYLKTRENKNPNRLHSAIAQEQPRIPVKVPRYMSSATYTRNLGPSTAQKQVLPPAGIIPASAPPWTTQREVRYDNGNFGVIKTPQAWTPSQRYFDEKTPIPEFNTPAMFAHQVQTNMFPVVVGWQQPFVPEPGMRMNEFGTAPPFLLSQPLDVVTKIVVGGEGHRKPIKAVAPKRKKG